MIKQSSLIQAENLGKRYGRNWIFYNLSLNIQPGSSWGILGSNGSGKSTLLRVLAGFESANKGTLLNDGLRGGGFYYTSPYIELYNELNLEEHFLFHQKLTGFKGSTNQLLEKCWLEGKNKVLISELSSGMKQRFKLALAFFGNEETLFLDEPTTNLDHHGKAWYQKHLAAIKNKTILVATNEPEVDLNPNYQTLKIEDFKKEQI